MIGQKAKGIQINQSDGEDGEFYLYSRARELCGFSLRVDSKWRQLDHVDVDTITAVGFFGQFANPASTCFLFSYDASPWTAHRDVARLSTTT